MKTTFFSLISILCFSNTVFVNAQSKSSKTETIILDDNNQSRQTTIEIKNGEIRVDGKKVANNDLNTNIKIIKKNGNAIGSNNDEITLDDNGFSFDMPDQTANNNKAMLGINLQPTKANNGAIIANVNPQSPAEKAGLQQGDIITKMDNLVITSPQDVVNMVATHQPGDKIKIDFKRNNDERNANVTLSKKEENQMRMYEGDPKEMFKNFGGLDNLFKNFNFEKGSFGAVQTPKIGAQAEDRADGDGVMITNIEPKSVAEKAGLRTGDIITKMGNKNISSVDDLTNVLAQSANEKNVNIEVKRNRNTEKLQLEIPKILKKKDF